VNDQRPKVTISEMVACAKREVSMREAVFPRRVATGKMSSEKAERETLLMEAIVQLLEGIQTTTRIANHMSSEDLPFQVDLFELLDDGKGRNT
jgi:hypothetical protein